MKKTVIVAAFVLLNFLNLFAQKQGSGSVSGIIIEKSSEKPLEFATVVIRSNSDSTISQGTVTGKKGEFAFDKLAFGEYKIVYSFIGFEKVSTPGFSINAKRTKIDLGKLYISESTSQLGDVSITAQRSTFVNSIDRRTFNVGQDVMSKTGSVSELLQNVPSVQVDIDGNVSLRGSDNVMFLINGKPSSLMGTNRAAVLQQMPASSIEKIEVITNPSAKYKPDGTSGIINIVLKKDKSLGLNGNLTANVGNNDRRNFNVTTNYNPGKLNLFGSFGIRQDDRTRISNMSTKTYEAGQLANSSTTNTIGHARPLYNLANAGIDYKLNDHNKVGVSANYNYRFQRQNDISTYTLQDNLGNTITDYD